MLFWSKKLTFETLLNNNYISRFKSYKHAEKSNIEIFMKDTLLYANIVNAVDRSFYKGSICPERFLPDGEGLFVRLDGDFYYGHFVNGLKEGKGIDTTGDLKYEGSFIQGKPHGIGKFYKVKKLIYEGEVQFGEYCGSGIYYSENLIYDGFFDNGKKIGNFIVRNKTAGKSKNIYKVKFDGKSNIGKGFEIN